MIYCVEDERNIRELIVYTLESSGFTARGLESGKELNAAIAEQLPDLILLDSIGSNKRNSGHYGNGKGR